jgi:hypothetical protein
MSKTTAQLAQLLSASNEQLYDRYINVTLYQKYPKATRKPDLGIKVFNTDISFAFGSTPAVLNVPAVNFGTTDFAIRTPPTGLKPHITVSGQFQLSSTTNLVTVTIVNMNANIDTMAYNYIEVEAGYMNSGVHVKFLGQITNCYMAKPNPNGELVISAVCSNLKDLYAVGAFEVPFTQEVVTTAPLILTCINAIKLKYPELKTSFDGDDALGPEAMLTKYLSPEWLAQEFWVGEGTRHFRSPFECLTWLNSLLATYTYGTGYASGPGGAPPPPESENKQKLPPIKLVFDHRGKLIVHGLFSVKASAINIKALATIGSAFMTSTSSATVTAPFNPGILPGEIIYVDPKYFRTRVNIDTVREAYKSMGNLWNVLSTEFTFSTQTTNTMTLQLVNIDNIITAKDG